MSERPGIADAVIAEMRSSADAKPGSLPMKENETMTLEQYLKAEFARSGAIDFAIRANVQGEHVTFYIHPHGKDGDTRDYEVDGNSLSPDRRVAASVRTVQDARATVTPIQVWIC